MPNDLKYVEAIEIDGQEYELAIVTSNYRNNQGNWSCIARCAKIEISDGIKFTVMRFPITYHSKNHDFYETLASSNKRATAKQMQTLHEQGLTMLKTVRQQINAHYKNQPAS